MIAAYTPARSTVGSRSGAQDRARFVIRLYLDEDRLDGALIAALRRNGFDALQQVDELRAETGMRDWLEFVR